MGKVVHEAWKAFICEAEQVDTHCVGREVAVRTDTGDEAVRLAEFGS